MGRVEGYLPPEEADFLDKDGKPCALWRIRYVTGELEDELEDVEWHERARGVPSWSSLHSNASSPGMMEVGGFSFEFEAVRTAQVARELAAVDPASGRWGITLSRQAR